MTKLQKCSHIINEDHRIIICDLFNRRYFDGEHTPLTILLSNEMFTSATMLINYASHPFFQSIDLNLTDIHGRSPLWYAINNVHTELAKLLFSIKRVKIDKRSIDLAVKLKNKGNLKYPIYSLFFGSDGNLDLSSYHDRLGGGKLRKTKRKNKSNKRKTGKKK
jgi:ankyrin repeat protein